MSWVSPTGFEDPDNDWTNEPKAYDEDTTSSSYAYTSTPKQNEWTTFIVFTIAEISCSKFRYFHGCPYSTLVDIDSYDGSWHDEYEGAIGSTRRWIEKDFPSARTITKVRIRFWCTESWGFPVTFTLREVDFWEVVVGLKKVARLKFPLCVALENMNVAKYDKVLKVNEGKGIVLVAKNALKGDLIFVL